MVLEARRARNSAEGEQHHPEGATAATEPKLLNGGGGQTEHERFATPVDYTMRN